MPLKPEQVKSVADAKKIVEERGLTHVKVGVFDVDGILRGKYMSKAKFFSALESGFGFCDVVLGWDCNDQLYDNVNYTGWHTAYPDAWVRIVPETCREMPFEDNMLFFLGEFVEQGGGDLPARRAAPRARHAPRRWAIEAYAAAEYEFFMFDETPECVREKGYRNLHADHAGLSSAIRCCAARSGPSSITRSSTPARRCACRSRACTPRPAPACSRPRSPFDKALEAADRAALFKTFMKVLAQRRGLMATFMAKWSNNWPGQSGHIHCRLKGKDGKSVFYDAKKPHSMSDKHALVRRRPAGADAGAARHGAPARSIPIRA